MLGNDEGLVCYPTTENVVVVMMICFKEGPVIFLIYSTLESGLLKG